jgi:hypothetical protein
MVSPFSGNLSVAARAIPNAPLPDALKTHHRITFHDPDLPIIAPAQAPEIFPGKNYLPSLLKLETVFLNHPR